MPGVRPVIVLLVPVPVMPPGFNVHVPVAGKPFNTLLPVGTSQVGCVIDPNIGADGVAGSALMIKLAEDIHVLSTAALRTLIM